MPLDKSDLDAIRTIIREELARAWALTDAPLKMVSEPVPPALVDNERAKRAALEAREKSRQRRLMREEKKTRMANNPEPS